MARDRIYISSDYRSFLESMKENGILGFDLISNKDIYQIAVALGLNNPQSISGKKDGYFLLKDLKSEDIALLNTVLLGTVKSNDDIEKFTKIDLNYDQSECCAQSGFAKLRALYEEAGSTDIFIKRLFGILDDMFDDLIS